MALLRGLAFGAILASHAIASRPIETTRAAACNAGPLPPVYFLLTSTPDRAARLPRLLKTLRQQTLRPKHIVLTIARRYGARFGNASYPELPRSLMLASKVSCAAFGRASE